MSLGGSVRPRHCVCMCTIVHMHPSLNGSYITHGGVLMDAYAYVLSVLFFMVLCFGFCL